MRRRQFITLLGGAAAWPMAAQAQHNMPVEPPPLVSSDIEPADRPRGASYEWMKHSQIISASLGYLEKLPG